jgi:hypothetical protein
MVRVSKKHKDVAIVDTVVQVTTSTQYEALGTIHTSEEEGDARSEVSAESDDREDDEIEDEDHDEFEASELEDKITNERSGPEHFRYAQSSRNSTEPAQAIDKVPKAVTTILQRQLHRSPRKRQSRASVAKPEHIFKDLQPMELDTC